MFNNDAMQFGSLLRDQQSMFQWSALFVLWINFMFYDRAVSPLWIIRHHYSAGEN